MVWSFLTSEMQMGCPGLERKWMLFMHLWLISGDASDASRGHSHELRGV